MPILRSPDINLRCVIESWYISGVRMCYTNVPLLGTGENFCQLFCFAWQQRNGWMKVSVQVRSHIQYCRLNKWNVYKTSVWLTLWLVCRQGQSYKCTSSLEGVMQKFKFKEKLRFKLSLMDRCVSYIRRHTKKVNKFLKSLLLLCGKGNII